MTDPSTQGRIDGVVTYSTPEMIRVISRVGRLTTFSSTSFRLLWTQIHGPCLVALCDEPGCDMAPVGRTLRDGSWHWSCGEHLPPTCTALTFPFDAPESQPESLALPQCPVCEAPFRTPGSGATAVEEQTLYNCGQCRSQWFVHIARGTDADGIFLADAVNTSADLLEPNCVSIRAYVGPAVLAAIQRAIGGAVTNIGTVPVNVSDRFGASTVVVVGDSPTRNVQRLGGYTQVRLRGGALYTCSEPEYIGRVPVRSDIPIGGATVRQNVWPAPGTVWTERTALHGTGVMVRVDRVDEDGNVFFRQDVDDPLQGLPVSDFMSRYWILHYNKPSDSDGVARREPITGETWWHHETDDGALILHVGESKIVVQTSSGEPRTFDSFEAFAKEYGQTPVEIRCAPGEEWEGPNGDLVRIEEVRLARREVICNPASGPYSRFIVGVRKFAREYRKLVRRSVYSFLDEDDDIDG